MTPSNPTEGQKCLVCNGVGRHGEAVQYAMCQACKGTGKLPAHPTRIDPEPVIEAGVLFARVVEAAIQDVRAGRSRDNLDSALSHGLSRFRNVLDGLAGDRDTRDKEGEDG